MVFSIDIFLIFILHVLLSLPLFPVTLILIANVQILCNLIGQEEYNIGRNILNIGVNIVLFGEKNRISNSVARKKNYQFKIN